jgi:colanic acid/amylovoran biosynthesis glycosyltransferase
VPAQNIAFIVRRFPTLSESFILRQIVGLLEAGHDVQIFAEKNPHDVQIFAEKNPQESSVHEDVIKYDLLSRTHYRSSVPRNKIVCRLKTLLLVILNFFRSPLKVIRAVKVNMQRSEGFSYPELYFVFSFLGWEFDIVQCHFGPAGRVGALLKQAGFRFKVVTAFHGYDVTSYVKQRGEGVFNTLFQVGDMFTYNSEATKEKVLALGCPAQKMMKLPMGVDTRSIIFSSKTLETDGTVNLLSVGRLVEMKGREYAVKAIAKVVKKYQNVSYTIVGDGILKESLEGLIKELGLGRWVHLIGWVDDEKLDLLYKSAHIFVHPSVTASDGNMEGQGVVLLEAQGYGLAVVATKHNAFTETVLDGKSGILVPERDVEALAEALEKLIGNPDCWLEMGRQGRKYVEKNYDIKSLNMRLIKLYEDLM